MGPGFCGKDYTWGPSDNRLAKLRYSQALLFRLTHGPGDDAVFLAERQANM
jgi:hypothetical protein